MTQVCPGGVQRKQSFAAAHGQIQSVRPAYPQPHLLSPRGGQTALTTLCPSLCSQSSVLFPHFGGKAKTERLTYDGKPVT